MTSSAKDIKQKTNNYPTINVLIFGVFIGMLLLFVFEKINKNLNGCDMRLVYVREVEDCDKVDEKKESFSNVEKSITQMIEVYTKTGEVTKVGVFVRDLKTTRFFGINENQQFVMASLLKVPLAIAGYKLAEVEPSVLDVPIVFTEKQNLYKMQQFPVLDQMVVGKQYQLRDVIERSIVYSDNSAAQMLSDFYAPGFFPRILGALSLNIERESGDEETIVTARSFANVFRSLYNSSYLTREYSNRILDTLTKTKFRTGALSKLPSDVSVAHKFAERSFFDPNDKDFKNPIVRQLHECGIVYASGGKEPYSFCILTEGKDYKSLEKVQAEISYKIYSAIEN